jgi:hypothetical protein
VASPPLTSRGYCFNSFLQTAADDDTGTMLPRRSAYEVEQRARLLQQQVSSTAAATAANAGTCAVVPTRLYYLPPHAPPSPSPPFPPSWWTSWTCPRTRPTTRWSTAAALCVARVACSLHSLHAIAGLFLSLKLTECLLQLPSRRSRPSTRVRTPALDHSIQCVRPARGLGGSGSPRSAPDRRLPVLQRTRACNMSIIRAFAQATLSNGCGAYLIQKSLEIKQFHTANGIGSRCTPPQLPISCNSLLHHQRHFWRQIIHHDRPVISALAHYYPPPSALFTRGERVH